MEGASQVLEQANLVVIVPGYGMAVAQAQHKVRELYDQLKKRGVTVKFAIHPVAGRMPGHMNVLLAEADIPYTDLVEMDEINPDMPQADVALVVGANDVVNPARSDKGSPIYGMPIIDADRARTVFAIKRSKNPGFAGIDNELYFSDKTWMLFGDAKNVIGELVKQMSGGSGLHGGQPRTGVLSAPGTEATRHPDIGSEHTMHGVSLRTVLARRPDDAGGGPERVLEGLSDAVVGALGGVPGHLQGEAVHHALRRCRRGVPRGQGDEMAGDAHGRGQGYHGLPDAHAGEPGGDGPDPGGRLQDG